MIIFPFLRVSSAFDSLDGCLTYWGRLPCLSEGPVASSIWPPAADYGRVSVIAILKHIGMPDSFFAQFDIVSNTCQPASCCLKSKKGFPISILWSRAGIRTWDLSPCLYLNLKHGNLDHSATTAGFYSCHLFHNSISISVWVEAPKKKCHFNIKSSGKVRLG